MASAWVISLVKAGAELVVYIEHFQSFALRSKLIDSIERTDPFETSAATSYS